MKINVEIKVVEIKTIIKFGNIAFFEKSSLKLAINRKLWFSF